MAFKVKIKDVQVENIVKGKNRYSKATVTYDYNGETRTQNIMSFSNPDVFKKVQDFKAGDEVAIDTTKNDKGYNEWAKVELATKEVANSEPPKGGKVTGSNYETKEERAAKQVLIVRQSCLAQAVAFCNEGTPVRDVLDHADEFVDWVFQSPDLFDQPNDDLGDVPV
jgi:hypothetical protein